MRTNQRSLLRKSWLLGAASVIAIAVFAAPSNRARAADQIVQPVPYAPPLDPAPLSWSGFSVGFGGGLNHFNTTSRLYSEDWVFTGDSVTIPDGPFPTLEEFCGKGIDINDGGFCSFDESFADLSATGAFGTVEVGYDAQHGDWVFGIFGDWSFGDADARQEQFGLLGGEFDGFDFKGASYAEGTVSFDDSFSIVGRVGRVVHQDVLIYGLFGWTWQDYEAQVNAWSEFGGAGFGWGGEVWGSTSGTTDGPTVGAGTEIRLHDGWSLKTEYRWAGLDGILVETTDGDGDCGGFPKDCENGGWAEFSTDDIDKHTVRAVISWRFNDPHPQY